MMTMPAFVATFEHKLVRKPHLHPGVSWAVSLVCLLPGWRCGDIILHASPPTLHPLPSLLPLDGLSSSPARHAPILMPDG